MSVVLRELQALCEGGPLGDLSDGQLLDRFVARREGADFEAIIRRHGPMVWGLCRRIIRDHHDSEDAFQATFLVLARRAASVMPGDNLGNWLHGVAYQTARKSRSLRARRRSREIQASEMPEPAAVPDNLRDGPDESIDREMTRLPEKYRIPVVLCDLEGRTHKEAARQLGWPIGTVSSRLSRARAILARRLSERGTRLSGGSLGVFLARDAGGASLHAKLISSTAQAASVLAAGGAAETAPAAVASFAREVMMAMFQSKFRLVTVAALLAATLSIAGIDRSHRARAAHDPSQDKTEEKKARHPAGGAPLWHVRFNKPGRSRVTLDANGVTATFRADKVTIDPDGFIAVQGPLPPDPGAPAERIKDLARLSESRGIAATVKIEFDTDGFEGSFVSERRIRVALGSDGLVRIRGE